MSTFREIRLPEDLCKTVEEKLIGSNFRNLEELLCFFLQELVGEDALQMDENEEKVIEDRLKALGYI